MPEVRARAIAGSFGTVRPTFGPCFLRRYLAYEVWAVLAKRGIAAAPEAHACSMSGSFDPVMQTWAASLAERVGSQV